MKKLVSLMLVATFAMVAGSAAVADAGTPSVDRREANQAERIRDGVRSDQLTRAETRRLVRGQARVHRLERRAKADGVVTAHERARLARAQNVQSREIARLRHNDRDRR